LGKDGATTFSDDSLGARGTYFETEYGMFLRNECWHPKAQPVVATIYFIIFVEISAFTLLSLFVGAVCGGMVDSLLAFEQEEEREHERLKEVAAKNANPNEGALEVLHDFFDSYDSNGNSNIEFAELMQALISIGMIGASPEEEHEMMLLFDRNESGTISFKEFVQVTSEGEISLYPDGDAQEKMMTHKSENRKQQIRQILSRAWGCNEKEKLEILKHSKLNPWQAAFFLLSSLARSLITKKWFNFLSISNIFLAAFIVGYQTELQHPGENVTFPILDDLNNFVLSIFTFEIILKILAEGKYPLRYFRDLWNIWDALVVLSCYAFVSPSSAMPKLGSILAMLRLMRFLRILKLLKAFPELQIIVKSLISGFWSLFFVTVLFGMFTYLYAIIGILAFQLNDPQHFGNLRWP